MNRAISPALLTYIEENFDLGSKSIYQVQHGALDKEWLEQPSYAE